VATARSVTEWSCRRTGVIITRGEYNTLSKSVYIDARGRSRKDNGPQVELTWRAFLFRQIIESQCFFWWRIFRHFAIIFLEKEYFVAHKFPL
jgi:hypothetical protein